ncbi:MAG: hypothetical protein H7836_09290 [Magnetococcus sp. YQC-3]
MSYIKTIVCFANSRSESGRCIAGKEWQHEGPGAWVRSIRHPAAHAIPISTQKLQGGRDLQPLDILSINFDRHHPQDHQTENHIITQNSTWSKRASLSWTDIDKWLDNPETLWGTDRVVYQSDTFSNSLFLVKVPQIKLSIVTRSPGNKAIQGHFNYKHFSYCLDVTDPAIESIYLAGEEGPFIIQNPILCISLAQFWRRERADGATVAYKLIAAILYRERFL